MEAALLATNGLLVVVTAVYVVLTGRLAREAAKSAKAAAESVRVQQAALEAQASQRHAWFKTAGGGRSRDQWEIIVIPLVGAYWVHNAELLDFEVKPEGDGEQLRTIVINKEMVPRGAPLPRRVDEVDGVWFDVDLAGPARAALGRDEWDLVGWRCLVTFSLAESDQSRRRLIVHLDPKKDPRARWLREAREAGFGG